MRLQWPTVAYRPTQQYSTVMCHLPLVTYHIHVTCHLSHEHHQTLVLKPVQCAAERRITRAPDLYRRQRMVGCETKASRSQTSAEKTAIVIQGFGVSPQLQYKCCCAVAHEQCRYRPQQSIKRSFISQQQQHKPPEVPTPLVKIQPRACAAGMDLSLTPYSPSTQAVALVLSTCIINVIGSHGLSYSF